MPRAGQGGKVRMHRAAFVIAMALALCAPVTAEGLPLGGFKDAIHHWQMEHGEDYPRHEAGDVRAIADNILLLQRAHGGWVQNRDPLQVMDARDVAALIAEQAVPDGSFDNRNIYTQIEYLMGAFALTGDARYRSGAERGLDYLLSQQFSTCGGWPHSVPAQSSYQARLTVADEVFSGPLTLLRGIVEAEAPLDGFSAEARDRAAEALARGEDCLLALQVRQGERLTGWAGQYDPVTRVPMGGRSFELPAIVSQETVAIVDYLMSIPDPSEEVIASVDGAVNWLRDVQITGLRLETVAAQSTADTPQDRPLTERQLVADKNAPPLWARFYDLADNSWVLANRDGVRVARYDQILSERRNGYSWFGEWPARLLAKNYPKWRCRVAGADADGEACR